MKNKMIRTSLLSACIYACLGALTFLVPAHGQSPQGHVPALAEKALAFKALLSSTQQTALQKPFSAANARRWSNLPQFACAGACRNGVRFADLNPAQLTAAKDVIAAAAGNTPGEGYEEFIQVTLADSVLGEDSEPGDYDDGLYRLAFLNDPSATGAWMLQFGGHHYAANLAYNKGGVIGATPSFLGVEPVAFTISGGKACAPLAEEQAALKAMLQALTAEQLTAARITGNFADVVLGPGRDANFPAAKAGIKAGGLSALQQSKILAAMDPFLKDADAATAAWLRSVYEAELADTYIGYAGNASLAADGHYVRIDGPSVWMELVVQDGVVNPDQIHYHAVWRDRKRDYGNNLADVPVTAARPYSKRSLRFSAAAIGGHLDLELHATVKDAEATVHDSNGKKVLSASRLSGPSLRLDIAALPKGFYTVRVEDAKTRLTSRFARL